MKTVVAFESSHDPAAGASVPPEKEALAAFVGEVLRVLGAAR